jgi:hypothetical protein
MSRVEPVLNLRHAGDDAADLDCRLGAARGDDGAGLRLCRLRPEDGVGASLLFGIVNFVAGALGGLVWVLSPKPAETGVSEEVTADRLPDQI